MSLHAIEIAADVAVAIVLCRLCGLRCRNIKPLAADATRYEMNMERFFQVTLVIAPDLREYVQFAMVPRL
jgi:hypothetical protein